MIRPSFRARLFAFRLRFLRGLRGIDSGDVLTVLALSMLWAGLAMRDTALACVVVGGLLALLTPIGAAVRILLRGR